MKTHSLTGLDAHEKTRTRKIMQHRRRRVLSVKLDRTNEPGQATKRGEPRRRRRPGRAGPGRTAPGEARPGVGSAGN